MSISVHFPKEDREGFYIILRKRVNQYFKSNKIAKHGNWKMWVKVIIMPLLYLLPFFIIMSNTIENPLLFMAMWGLMALGMAGTGLGIMHDANHGTISKNKSINSLIGSVINLVGGSKITWKIQHNVLHHTYTNVEGMDEDINTVPMMRFSPNKKRLKIQKYQYLYAWVFYSLMTLYWSTAKDFIQLIRYEKEKLIIAQQSSFGKELFKLIVFKTLYYIVFLVLPIVVLDIHWVWVVAGFVSMHLICGLILASVFQSAHVMKECEFPMPKDGEMENSWAINQILTTSNFAPKNKLLSWYVGGLNYQIEHHLFPTICHVHYKNISKIVQEVSKEFGLPYNSKPTFFSALRGHLNMLKKLGQPNT